MTTKYTRLFGVVGGTELNSWSMESSRMQSMHGTVEKYADSLTNNGRSMIGWEQNEEELCIGLERRIAQCIKAIQQFRLFTGWARHAGGCEPLREALRGVGINIEGSSPATTTGPRKPPPVICPEIWHTKEFDPAEAWAATMAACKGGGTV